MSTRLRAISVDKPSFSASAPHCPGSGAIFIGLFLYTEDLRGAFRKGGVYRNLENLYTRVFHRRMARSGLGLRRSSPGFPPAGPFSSSQSRERSQDVKDSRDSEGQGDTAESLLPVLRILEAHLERGRCPRAHYPWQKGPPQKESWYTHRPLTHWYRSFGVVCPSAQLQMGPAVTFLMVPSVQQAAQ